MTDYTEQLRDESLWRDGWQTKDGRLVRIYANDGDNAYPIHGAIHDEGWQIESWTAGGEFNVDSPVSTHDLIPRPKRIQGWVNMYPWSHASKGEANMAAGRDRVACVYIDVPEGEGLE